ncbi:MAG: hypothetical protein H8E73_08330 [Planctomycetes bacterium]|nr:hypothetical protein [Planctomycetota bacterium]
MNVRPPQLVVPEGPWGTVEFAIRTSGKMPAQKFLRDLGDDAARAMALFREMVEYGRVLNSVRFSQEAGKIYAFKHRLAKKNRQVRWPCFQIGNRWLLTHGFFKPGAQRGRGKWPREELQRALQIKREHLELESP